MKLIKKQVATAPATGQSSFGLFGEAIDRRTFLRRSGLVLGGAAVATALPVAMMKKVRAAEAIGGAETLNVLLFL